MCLAFSNLCSNIERQANCIIWFYFQVFELRSTLFSATGYAPEYCICNMHKVKEEQPNHFMFELEWRHEFRGHENPKVTICPRCYTTFSNSGNDEERKTFLKMVHEVSKNKFYHSLCLGFLNFILNSTKTQLLENTATAYNLDINDISFCYVSTSSKKEEGFRDRSRFFVPVGCWARNHICI